MEEIRAHNLRRVAEAETLFVDPASGARTMLHELEGEVDVVRHTFATAAGTGDLGFYRNKRSRRDCAANGRQAGFASGQPLVGLNLSASDVPNFKQRLGRKRTQAGPGVCRREGRRTA